MHYGSNGMVPNRTPGIVGHDWNLNIGGVITRTVRGIPDDAPYNGDQEFWTTPFMLASQLVLKSQTGPMRISDLYGFTNSPGTSQNTYGFAYLHKEATTPVSGDDANRFFPMYVFSKSLTEPLITLYGKYKDPAAATGIYRSGVTFAGTGAGVWYNTPEAEFFDIQPDVFHFNVCGYSGDFVMGLGNEVKVYNTNVPSGEISIAFEVDTLNGNNSYKYFWGGWARIVIKVGDGTQFIFENNMRTRRTMEFDNLNVLETSTCSREAWHLSSIKVHNGREAKFEYGMRVVSSSRIPPLGGIRYWIDSDDGYYTPSDFMYQYIPQLDNVVIGSTNISLTYEKYDNNTKSRLENLTIKQGAKKIKQVDLTYINQFNEKDLYRNFLRSVSVSGEGKYQMEYLGIDSSLPVGAPQEGKLNLDHWGYYNAKSEFLAAIYYDQTGEEVIDDRYHSSAPDSVSASFGMLSKMKWPTGGYTKYTYQAHRYDKVVSLDKVATDEYEIGEVLKDNTPKLPSRIVGGLRIKKIENYDKSGVLTGSKEYQYKIGLLCKEPFHSGMFGMLAAPNATISVLDPSSYPYRTTNEWPISGKIVVSGHMISSDFNQVGQNHIVYPDVSEINADGSYTRYEYLSFLDSAWRNFKSEKRAILTQDGERLDADFFAKGARDEIELYNLGSSGLSMYYANGIYNRTVRMYQKLMRKSSVNDLGFGQPNRITSYNAINQIVIRKTFGYNYSTSKNTLWYPQTPLTGPGKTYIGLIKPTVAENPLLVWDNETIYYHGGIQVNKKTTYMYNNSHQMNTKIESSSSLTDIFKTHYYYPKDYVVDSPSPISGGMTTVYNYPSGSSGIIIKAMVDRNVVNKPLSVSQTVNSNQTQRTDYTYVQSGDLVNLSQITQTGTDGQVLQTNVEYYDNQGRPLQVRYPDGKVETIVWGYGGRFVVAKIENQTKVQVESLIGSLQDPLAGTLDYQKEKKLRAVSDAYVTTCEYTDGVGISRITQPDGTSAFFVYNEDGKLVGTFDKDGNPVSSVNYNIQY